MKWTDVLFEFTLLLACIPVFSNQCGFEYGTRHTTINLRNHAAELITGCTFVFSNQHARQRTIRFRDFEEIPSFLVNISGGSNETIDVYNNTAPPMVQAIEHRPIRVFVQANMDLESPSDPYIRLVPRPVPWDHRVDRSPPVANGAVLFSATNYLGVGAPCGIQTVGDENVVTFRHSFTAHDPNRLKCQWIIENPDNVMLNFRLAYLNNPENSSYTLALEDEDTNQVIMRFGTSASNRTTVYNRILRVNLVVYGGRESGIQFAINITGIPCDFRLTRQSANITWLGSDRWYRSNVCRWAVEVPENHYIILNFDVFRVHSPRNWSLNISTSAPARSEVFETTPTVPHRIIPSNKAQFEVKISSLSTRCLSFTIRYSSLDSLTVKHLVDYYERDIPLTTSTVSALSTTVSPPLPILIYSDIPYVYILASPCGISLPEQIDYLQIWHQWTINRANELLCRWRIYNSQRRNLHFELEILRGKNFTLQLASPDGMPLSQYDMETNLNVVYDTSANETVLDMLSSPLRSKILQFKMSIV
ncbi:hypothetical protein CRM22_007322 [Opisthorchis felineus]|uniref:CUB domain-containing protein n=1 Tax=Opisthorchis felineus TaxID=147828 RepID=A0A4S2LH37_OPIFE|nr:hypothetical protein CRM22_007322 [Opisthorchis felineus]